MVKILIVEDDPLMSRMYQRMFNLEGYEIELAHDGQEGLDKARANKPVLILLDIMMPKMNGLQTLDELKADPNTKNIPVVMLSNLTGEEDAETALSKGAISYIIKSSFEPNQVIAMIKDILSKLPSTEIPQNNQPSLDKKP